MLGQLHIKNIGIIEEITINFYDGLNILTGETGAGKSLIIDSINAITGGRISKDLIKTGADMAFVEACFFNRDEETTILSREIYPSGRTICKINGKMSTISEMKEVGEALIDIHGQHENQSLLNAKTHIELLDNFLGEQIENIKTDYRNFLGKYKEIKLKIEQNYGDEKERARRIDLLKYQVDEIEIASLKKGEEEELEHKRRILQNAEKIATSLNEAYNLLDGNALETLSEITRKISNISDIDEKYMDILNLVNESYYTLQDVASTTSKYLSDVDFDKQEQTEIEERLDIIFSLKRKYGNTVEDVLKYYEDASNELYFLNNSEEMINELKKELSNIEDKLESLSSQMHSVREKSAKELEKRINAQLQDLEMTKAYVQFEFKKSEEYRENGTDIVQLLICTNVGEGLKPLGKIASGGEISRVMLAIKTILCEYDSVETMIFDEIDTGISGQAGKAVAEKMKKIGKTHQVICVTHLPVIAASGDANFYIKKEIKNEKTTTTIKHLNEEETIMEVARILSGKDITQMALEHVKELRKAMAE